MELPPVIDILIDFQDINYYNLYRFIPGYGSVTLAVTNSDKIDSIPNEPPTIEELDEEFDAITYSPEYLVEVKNEEVATNIPAATKDVHPDYTSDSIAWK